MWGGVVWGGGPWAAWIIPVGVVPVAAGAGGNLDAWDRRFSRELEKKWLRPKKKGRRIKVDEDDDEIARILRMLGFLP